MDEIRAERFGRGLVDAYLDEPAHALAHPLLRRGRHADFGIDRIDLRTRSRSAACSPIRCAGGNGDGFGADSARVRR